MNEWISIVWNAVEFLDLTTHYTSSGHLPVTTKKGLMFVMDMSLIPIKFIFSPIWAALCMFQRFRVFNTYLQNSDGLRNICCHENKVICLIVWLKPLKPLLLKLKTVMDKTELSTPFLFFILGHKQLVPLSSSDCVRVDGPPGHVNSPPLRHTETTKTNNPAHFT